MLTEAKQGNELLGDAALIKYFKYHTTYPICACNGSKSIHGCSQGGSGGMDEPPFSVKIIN